MIMLKIGIIIDDDGDDFEYLEEIGEYLAKDVVGTLYNGHDYIDAKYMGCEKL